MSYKMKKKQIFWASVCLLLSLAPGTLSENPEDDEEYTSVSGTSLPPLKLLNSFCALKMDDGPCKAFMRKFFFNIFTQQCEEFIYGGCGGNKNRFDSLEQCKENCIPDYSKIAAEKNLQGGKPFFCFLEEDPGICRGYITRYFYNNQTKLCERFKYGGCLGNRNNFETLEECKSTCENEPNDIQVEVYRTEPQTVKYDSLSLQPTKVPKLWEYHGPSWCLTPADRGLCKANVNRFYFNLDTGKCQLFNYSGCGGNENNFTTRRACFRACKKGFLKRISKGQQIKTKRKRKNQSVKILHEETTVETI
ncbi:tissue factor pathway inhibitor [Perognathus longimembris pacificus]|uniref:tissue factor pathway inhibitor n=1 Tax=Perognathus longimembris pacificus TaxID=214514 RepID=UPI0020193EB4|nr:tissue factor pathway inhibitor [Perognathus longimembris pacificus]